MEQVRRVVVVALWGLTLPLLEKGVSLGGEVLPKWHQGVGNSPEVNGPKRVGRRSGGLVRDMGASLSRGLQSAARWRVERQRQSV